MQPLWKTEWWFLKKLKVELYDPVIPLLGICPKELKAGTGIVIHIPIIIPNSQKVEATQMSIDRWMAKQNVVYTYNGIVLFNLKKEGNYDTCYNKDDPWKHYAEK